MERKQGLKSRAIGEFNRFAAMFIYLWILFGVFVLNEKIVLGERGISFEAEGLAFVNALVLAKVMLVAEALDLGGRGRSERLIYPILQKSFAFAVLFICFHIVEGVIVGVFHGKPIAESVPLIGGGSPAGVASVGAVLFVALIPFFAFREVSHALGEGELQKLLFARRVPAEGATLNTRRRDGAPRGAPRGR
jgi:hypothetical protein